MAKQAHKLRDLFGMLGKPPRSLAPDDMDEAVARALVEKYERSRQIRDQDEDDGDNGED